MEPFKQHFVQDLTQTIKDRHCGSIVFNADNESNVVSVSLFNGSEPVAISGSVVGSVICPDGATVPLTGSYSGNTASVTLTGDCFAVLGQISVGIQIVDGTQKITVLKAYYDVEALTTENVVDPGSRITLEVGDLIDDIGTAVASIPADYSDLLAAIAPNYSDLTYPVKKGQLCWYDGTLYSAKEPIASASSWESTKWQSATVDGTIPKNIVDGTGEGAIVENTISGTSANVASGAAAHAEGKGTKAVGAYSHAEGEDTTATGTRSHAEGRGTSTLGFAAHSEGDNTFAKGQCSHAEGYNTTATHHSQHVFGRYNALDPSEHVASQIGTYAEIVGNGTSDNARSNARTLDWSGNEELAGDLTINKNGANEMTVGEELSDLKSKIGEVLDIESIPSKNLNKTPYPATATTKGVTFTRNSDGSISMSGSPTGDIFWPARDASLMWLLPAGTYTISSVGHSRIAFTLNMYANRTDTSTAMQKAGGTTATTFTTDTDYWAFLRIDIVSGASTDGVTLYPQVEAGTQATEYQAPDEVSYSSAVLDGLEDEMTELTSNVDGLSDSVNDLGDEVNGLSTTVSGITEVVVGKNKVNPSKLVTGHIQSDGSVATNGAYAIYSTSEYIPLTGDTDYVFSAYNSSGNLRTGETVVCALFDESKNVIANSYQSVSGTGYLAFNSGSTAKFARVTTKTSGSFFQLESGRTTPSAYEAYTSHDVIALPLGDVPMEQVQNEIDDAINNSGIVQYEVGKNKVDPANLVTGYIQPNGSVPTNGAYAYYSTSDYIPLEANADYVFALYNANNRLRTDQGVTCLLFDESKTPISGSYDDRGSSTNPTPGYLTFNSGATAKYARVTGKTSGSFFQVEKSEAPTGFEAYNGGYRIGYPLGNIPMAQSQTGNVLYGKKWAVCGDSFTDGATDVVITDDGIYKGYRYVYPYLIGNRNDMKIAKFFNGGETLAFPAEPGTFTNSLTNPNGGNYYQNIPEDADYITIYLGINDHNHATGSSQDGESTEGLIPIGEITDNTTATYYGAWNVVLTWLITNRPHAHIGIIVCNGISSTDTYRQAQIAIAKKYGLPYMDLNGDARTPSMHRTCNPDIADAVKTALLDKWSVSSSNSHPNDAAHLFESTFIENFLRGI